MEVFTEVEGEILSVMRQNCWRKMMYGERHYDFMMRQMYRVVVKGWETIFISRGDVPSLFTCHSNDYEKNLRKYINM